MSDNKSLKSSQHIYKNVIGFIVLFIFVIIVIPYVLAMYAPFAVFITYFANVDIVANILSINYPSYFLQFY